MLNNLDKQPFWGDKRYHSLDFNLKSSFGKKLYKLSLNGGMTCPNRDGTLDYRGCIFCSQGGSGLVILLVPNNYLSLSKLKKPKNLLLINFLLINRYSILPTSRPTPIPMLRFPI